MTTTETIDRANAFANEADECAKNYKSALETSVEVIRELLILFAQAKDDLRAADVKHAAIAAAVDSWSNGDDDDEYAAACRLALHTIKEIIGDPF